MLTRLALFLGLIALTGFGAADRRPLVGQVSMEASHQQVAVAAIVGR